jgi:hypothetical protein
MDGTPTAEATAAAIAPILTRLRLAISGRVAGGAADVAARYDAGESLPVLAMLRNLLPDRRVAIEQVHDVFAYRPPAEVDEALAALVAADLVEVAPSVALTARGGELMNELHRMATSVVDELWAGHEAGLEGLAVLLGRVVGEAGSTGGGAFAVMAPPWEPPGALTSALVAERLSALRFHRSDAHIAAWRAAGLDAEAIQALEPGPTRDAIEQETNRRAAAPYAVLSADERFALCAGLGALPG